MSKLNVKQKRMIFGQLPCPRVYIPINGRARSLAHPLTYFIPPQSLTRNTHEKMMVLRSPSYHQVCLKSQPTSIDVY